MRINVKNCINVNFFITYGTKDLLWTPAQNNTNVQNLLCTNFCAINLIYTDLARGRINLDGKQGNLFLHPNNYPVDDNL